jgi:hypothetical protein
LGGLIGSLIRRPVWGFDEHEREEKANKARKMWRKIFLIFVAPIFGEGCFWSWWAIGWREFRHTGPTFGCEKGTLFSS